ncbi:Uncharacterised protein [uncultured archaeon]|nr:Uncharacterised protein [uncultured archaeon]
MLNIISIILYMFVGIICIIMAYKSIFTKKFLPFHEDASRISWEYIDKPLQLVILTILKISGLGFFIVGLLLVIFPIVNYVLSDYFVQYAIPIISLLYCFGIFIFNYNLHKKTEANTPWKATLIALLIIIIGLIISAI